MQHIINCKIQMQKGNATSKWNTRKQLMQQKQQIHSQAKIIFHRRLGTKNGLTHLHLFIPINLKSEKAPPERAAFAANWEVSAVRYSSWCIAVNQSVRQSVGVWLKAERSLTLSKVTLGIKWAQVKRTARKLTKCAHDGPCHVHTHTGAHTSISARVDALNQNRCRKQVQPPRHGDTATHRWSTGSDFNAFT